LLPKTQSNKFQSFSASTPADLETQMDAALAAAKAAYETQIALNTAQVQLGENYSALRCDPAPNLYLDLDDDAGTAPISVDVTTPAFITENGASDSITIIYGNTSRGSIPTRISSVESATNKLKVDNNISCRQDNVALILKDINKGFANQCQAIRLKSSADGYLNSNLDADTVTVEVDPTTIDYGTVAPGDRLACIGRVQRSVFAVNGNQLTKDINGTGPQAIVDEIVGLQAQYGISASANSEIVDINNPASWVNATGAWAAPLTVANRNRIKAVRLALIARNNLYEKDIVSQECNGAAAGPAKVCVWGGNAGLSATLGADWNHYRYRVYELIVPLKNVLTASPQL
jgi:type IV pilus assembly protein PilW